MLAHGRKTRRQNSFIRDVIRRQLNPAAYISAAEAGLMIGKPSGAVYTLAQRGAIKAVYDNGKWFIDKESVERYLERVVATDHPSRIGAA